MLTWGKGIKSSIWQLLGNVWVALMTFFSGTIVARMLGVTLFGKLSYILTYVSVFMILSKMGLDGVVSRELSKPITSQRSQKVIKASFRLQLGGAFLAYGIMLTIAWLFEEDPVIIKGIAILGLMLFTCVPKLLEFWYNSHQRGGYIALSNCMSITAGAVGKWLCLEWGFGIHGVLWVMVGEVLVAGVIYLIGSTEIPVAGVLIRRWTVEKYLFKHSWPLLISAIAIVLYQRIDVMMLKSMSTFEEIGQYAVGNKFSVMINLVPVSLASALSPLIFHISQKDKNVYNQHAQLFMDICFWGAMVPCILFFFLAPYLVPFFFGSSYAPAILLSQISIWRAVFTGMGISSGKLILAENLQNYALFRTFGGLIVNIGLNYIWIPRAGSVGAAYATLAGFAVANILMHAIVPPFRQLLRMQLNTFCFGLQNIYRQRTLLTYKA